MGDEVFINLRLLRSRKDFSRWSFQHQILKNGTELAAVLQVDGAWMDMTQRKLATPPPEVFGVFENIEKADGFEWA